MRQKITSKAEMNANETEVEAEMHSLEDTI